MRAEDILSRFGSVRRLKRGSWQARCPCHNDKQASLTISEDGDKILMHCHAGCDTADIVAAVGLEMTDLFNGEKPQKKTSNGFPDDTEAVYYYGDYVKIRRRGKVIRYGTIQNNKFVPGMPPDTEKVLYRSKNLRKSIDAGYTVFYAEGEKDADNVAALGLTAVTAGGVSDWQAKFAEQFRGAKLCILADNDAPGQELAQKIMHDVKGLAYSVKIVTPSCTAKGDVSDFLDTAADDKRTALLKLVNSEREYYAPWVKLNKDGMPSGIYTDILAQTIAKTMKYIILHVPGVDVSNFCVYRDGKYKTVSKNEAKSYIWQYLPPGTSTDAVLNNTYNLLLSSPENTHKLAEMNADESIINLQNGVLNLRTRQLENHDAKHLTTMQLHCNYDENAKCEKWLDFVNTLCSNDSGEVDAEKVSLLQEWTGLILSNVDVSRTKKCFMLYSALGNTGKSVYLNMLVHLLGIENTVNLPIQNMHERFALSTMCGKRADIVGDQTAEDIEDSSEFKSITGAEGVMNVEFKGKQSFGWHFTCAIVVACNSLPSFKDDKGGHIFERMSILPCDKVIAEKDRDGALSRKLQRESDGIFMWALQGLYRMRDNGFKFSDCKASRDLLNEYRAKLDTMYCFLSKNFEITGDNSDRIKKTDFEKLYAEWCERNQVTPLKKANIKERAAKNGVPLVKYCGNYVYKGLRVADIKEDVSGEEMPFK